MSRGDSNSAAADAGAASESSHAALSELPALISKAMAGDQFRTLPTTAVDQTGTEK